MDKQRQRDMSQHHYLECHRAATYYGKLLELGPHDQPRMAPAREHFEPDELAGRQLDLLIEIRNDLVLRDRGAQPDFDLIALTQLAFH